MEAQRDVLQLVAGERPNRGNSVGLQRRAVFLTRLRGELSQRHFVVNGVPVPDMIRAAAGDRGFGLGGFDFVSVADDAWPADAAEALRQLAGQVARDVDWDVLEPDGYRYMCARCAVTSTAARSRSRFAQSWRTPMEAS